MKTKHALGLAFGLMLCYEAKADSLTNGLVAYYQFRGDANDASGNGNNATPAGNYQFVTGHGIRIVGDNSQYYAGGGYVMLPMFGSNMNSGFSVSLWVKDEVIGADAVGSEAYVTFQPQDVYPHCQIFLLNNQSPPVLSFEIHSGVSAASFNKPIDLATYASSYKHLVLASEPGRFVCYVNGSNIYQTNVFYSNIFPAPYNALGRHWWPTGSSARMSVTYDNVRIYKRALTDAEAQELYVVDRPDRVLNIFTAIELNFLTDSNKVFFIQSSPDVISWTNYDGPFLGDGNFWSKTYSIRGQNKLFYRVEESPWSP